MGIFNSNKDPSAEKSLARINEHLANIETIFNNFTKKQIKATHFDIKFGLVQLKNKQNKK